MFLRHVSAHWQPKEPKKQAILKCDPASMGSSGRLMNPRSSPRGRLDRSHLRPNFVSVQNCCVRHAALAWSVGGRSTFEGFGLARSLCLG